MIVNVIDFKPNFKSRNYDFENITCVGIDVGLREGLQKKGIPVGNSDGNEEGMIDGFDDGVFVGMDEGKMDGIFVGKDEGE